MFNRTCRFLFTVIICVASTVVWAAEQDVVGVWRFVKEIDYRSDGTTIEIPPPEGYTGLLIYTQEGYMSAQIFPRGRTWNSSNVTLKDLKSTLDLSTSYFGRYEIDWAKKQVTQKLQEISSQREKVRITFVSSSFRKTN